MEDLLAQLLDRWEQAFDQINALSQYKAQVLTTRYADGQRYNIERFDHASFPAGGILTGDKENLTTPEIYEYGFNNEALPVYVTFTDNNGHFNWAGFYRYSETLVEYVEFCLETGTPSVVTRLHFDSGKKTVLQHIFIASRGSVYSNLQLPKEEVIQRIRKGQHVIAMIKRYEYGAENRIEKSLNLEIVPGSGKFTSHEEYAYDGNGELDTVRKFWRESASQLIYCKPSGNSPEELVDRLATALANAVVTTFAAQTFTEPIAILELSYHYADVYIPMLIWYTESEVAALLAAGETFNFLNDYDRTLDVDDSPFEREFAQLEQIMEETENFDLGRAMVRKAASLLNLNKLHGKVNITEDFAAYAADWTIEGYSTEDLEEILVDSGLVPETLQNWKQRGILK